MKIVNIVKKLFAKDLQIEKVKSDMEKFERKLKKLKAEYAAIEDSIINNFPKDEIKAMSFSCGSIRLEQTDIPTIKNWDKVCAFAKEHGVFSIFQKRLSSAAVKEIMLEGGKIPGVTIFHKKVLKLSKAKK